LELRCSGRFAELENGMASAIGVAVAGQSLNVPVMATDSATESENSMWTVCILNRRNGTPRRFRIAFEYFVVIRLSPGLNRGPSRPAAAAGARESK
jgi:hypothetical protein